MDAKDTPFAGGRHRHHGDRGVLLVGGEAWTPAKVPAPGKGKASVFNEVSCVSAVSCVAVGQLGPFESTEGNGLGGLTNGTSWKLVAAP
jgi:hypothetical protein